MEYNNRFLTDVLGNTWFYVIVFLELTFHSCSQACFKFKILLTHHLSERSPSQQVTAGVLIISRLQSLKKSNCYPIMCWRRKVRIHWHFLNFIFSCQLVPWIRTRRISHCLHLALVLQRLVFAFDCSIAPHRSLYGVYTINPDSEGLVALKYCLDQLNVKEPILETLHPAKPRCELRTILKQVIPKVGQYFPISIF